MNRDREEKKKRKTRLIQQLQERNNILEDKILHLQDDWNINQRVIEELQEEQYTSSSEAEETSSILSVEFIESTPQEERKPEARRTRHTIGTPRLTQPQTPIPRKKTKKEERKEGLERAIAWARDRKNYRAGKK